MHATKRGRGSSAVLDRTAATQTRTRREPTQYAVRPLPPALLPLCASSLAGLALINAAQVTVQPSRSRSLARSLAVGANMRRQRLRPGQARPGRSASESRNRADSLSLRPYRPPVKTHSVPRPFLSAFCTEIWQAVTLTLECQVASGLADSTWALGAGRSARCTPAPGARRCAHSLTSLCALLIDA